MSDSQQKKIWYGVVMRHHKALVDTPVLSTILYPTVNTHWPADGQTHLQELSDGELSSLTMQANQHRANICAMFVEFKRAEWRLDILEVEPFNPKDIPKIIQTIELQ